MTSEQTSTLPPLHSATYRFTADQADSTGRMPLWLIVSRIIEVATAHANRLGIGYADLVPLGIGWVLSRLSVEIAALPPVNTDYTFVTWIDSLNRHFSDRCMTVTDPDGRELMHIRTTWICIDLRERALAPLDAISPERFPIPGLSCPVAPMGKIRPLPEGSDSFGYTFLYDDIDINRHVNTVQWVRLILNAFSPEWHETHAIRRFDIEFRHECRYGQTARVATAAGAAPGVTLCEITDPEGRRAVASSITATQLS